jgi:hypothetical protein
MPFGRLLAQVIACIMLPTKAVTEEEKKKLKIIFDHILDLRFASEILLASHLALNMFQLALVSLPVYLHSLKASVST